MRRVSPRWLLALVLGSGCGRDSGPAPGTGLASLEAPDLGPVVARVGDVPIHAAEVAAQAQRSGRPPPPGAGTISSVFQLLVERARQRVVVKINRDPTADALLVQRLLGAGNLEPKLRPQDIPEEELRRAYRAGEDPLRAAADGGGRVAQRLHGSGHETRAAGAGAGDRPPAGATPGPESSAQHRGVRRRCHHPALERAEGELLALLAGADG